MSVYPEWRAGNRILASKLAAGLPVYIENTGAQTNNTTTLANATDLLFTAEASARYLIMLRASYDAPTATDIKVAWSGPSGSAMDRNILANAAGTTTNIDTAMINLRRSIANAQVAGAPNAVTNAFSVWREDSILLTASAGVCQLQFAANAAGTVTLQTASCMIVQRVG